MNVDNQTILHIKAGHLPPDDLIQLLLSKKPTAMGFSIQNVLDDKPDLAILKEDASGASFDDIKRVLVNSKDWPVTLYIGMLKAGYNPEDIQPFVLQDPESKDPFISVFIEGDIVGHGDPADRTEQYNFVNGILLPKINEFCFDFEGDLDKITAKLRGDIFKKEFMMHVGHRAELHIMPVSGDMICLGKNDLGEIYDWGSISNKLGYGDVVVQEPKKTITEKVAARFGGWGKKATAEPEAKPEVHKTDDNGIHHIDKNIEKGADSSGYPAKKDNKQPILLSKPPEWARNKNDDTRLWYEIVGNLPSGKLENKLPAAWKKGVSQVVLDQEAVKITNLDAFKAYALQRKMLTGSASSTSSGKPPAETTAHDVKNIAADLPILNKDTLEKVLEFVATLDTSSKSIIPPKDIQAMEAALPNFADAVGLKDSETLNWPVHNLKKIGDIDVMALVCYAVMWRNKWRAIKAGQLEAGKKTEVVKDNDKQTITSDGVKTEAISKEAAPAAKKASGGWGRKAA